MRNEQRTAEQITADHDSPRRPALAEAIHRLEAVAASVIANGYPQAANIYTRKAFALRTRYAIWN
jgi:hypothetical protein